MYDSEEDKAKFLRIPYRGNKFSMLISLPNKDQTVNDLLKRLDTDGVHRVLGSLKEHDVHLLLPKFKFHFLIKLRNILQELGINNIFTSESSFPLLINEQSQKYEVSNIIQKAGIEIDENGSVAFAAAAVSIVEKFGKEEDFIVDRPFLFYIIDETTNTLLFAGKVINPTKTA